MADLVRLGYVPALACLGVTEGGQILNVNADTMAAALAAGLGARRLIIAGGTAGVFDKQGQTIPLLDLEGIDALIGDGTASAGMIAKLRACRAALDARRARGRDCSRARSEGPARGGRDAHHDGEGRMSSGTVETTATSDIQAREARHVLQTYRRFPVAFVRGEGVRLFDAEGRSYLDLLSGIGVAALGNGSARLADAIGAQARELAHTSNLFFHPLQGQLADRLTRPRAWAAPSSATAAARPTRRA